MKNYEQRRLVEITQWEEQYFAHEVTDIEYAYYQWTDRLLEKWGDKRKHRLLKQLDSVFFSDSSLAPA